MYGTRWIDKLERKIGKHTIHNLMTYIVAGMSVVFVLDYFVYAQNEVSFGSFIIFDRDAVMSGQVWRLLSFVFFPPDFSPIFIIFSLYLYWLIGTSLERAWGSFKFNFYYICGIIGAVISGMITGYATNVYLNLSLFLAFSIIYPDYELLIFFFLPIKVKYLAILDAAGLIFLLIVDSWPGKLALLFAMFNLILFFGGDFINRIKNIYRRYKFRRDSNAYRR